ncbi:MAG: formimidoylglutamate deiminase [Acidobacteriaceae bacterium]|nr:formimidoylglutamate deiminase [Acidobacteriaceae bacterium]MBV9502790.1 formimidoylglutamate deiminase [Acidobacteriaceae bacterium]
MKDTLETGWTADLVWIGAKFESGVALLTDASGRVTGFSRNPNDLASATRFPNRAILPGLVNVHSHSFQRAIRARTEHRTSATTDTFWTWREAMYRAANLLSPEDVYHVARMAFLEMLLSGITTVGEFHYLHNEPDGTRYQDPNLLPMQVIRAAENVGLRIALLRAAYARAGWKKPENRGQARFITPNAETFISDTEALRSAVSKLSAAGGAWIGVAPHSIRSLPLEYLLRAAEYARAEDLPLHMHAAEQPEEVEQCLEEHGLRPIELLDKHGVLDERFTAIHAIHVNGDEIASLGRGKVHVCACPTSERNLGDGVVPADRLMNSGPRICFGSDSNIQINLFEDARELEYHLRMQKLQRAVLATESEETRLAERLFQSATLRGAEALGVPVGEFEPGKAADFFAVDLDDPSIAGSEPKSLLSNLVFSLERTAIRDVFVGGRQIVEEGRHPRQVEIVNEFKNVQRRLWGQL